MSLVVQELWKSFDGRPVVEAVSFDVSHGELVGLLGPSGSGKSTVLRIIAGLTNADSGCVTVDGSDVTHLPPQVRDLGFVFQNYALFEHLTVAENIEFALRVRGASVSERRKRRAELLELVGLAGSAAKFPSQLSGGQRQRTALARALAHRPKLLLLDEPFGALDARIRQELRQGLRALLKQLGTTAIFVTHDQEEAFCVADRILILHRGRLLEQGTPQQLYQTPRTEFVASFVGRANLLPAELAGPTMQVRLWGAASRVSGTGRRVKALVRPEDIALFDPEGHTSPSGQVIADQARVEHVEYLGASERLVLSVAAEGPDGGVLPWSYLLDALRPIDERETAPLRPGDVTGVAVRACHAISRPSLRVLVASDLGPGGEDLIRRVLDFGEREHAVMTLLAPLEEGSTLSARFDVYRQAFAGDLRLVDTRDQVDGLYATLHRHLIGNAYDLVVLRAGQWSAIDVLALLRLPRVDHVVLVPETASGPLGPREGTWRLEIQGGGAAQTDLGLFAELAERLGSRVQVMESASDPGGDDEPASARAPVEVTRRVVSMLLQRHVPFEVGTCDTNSDAAEAVGHARAVSTPDLVAVDLGARSKIDARARCWLEPLPSHPVVLMTRPDDSEPCLGVSASFKDPATSFASTTERVP